MNIEDRVTALETRARASEDQLEIIRLIFTYGPLIDSDEPETAARLWIEGGIHDVGGYPQKTAPDGIVASMQGMRELNKKGCTHFYAMPQITLSGDTAQGVGYSIVILKEDDGFKVWRAAVNYWTFVRTAQGWRINERFNREINGSEESRALMRKVMSAAAAQPAAGHV